MARVDVGRERAALALPRRYAARRIATGPTGAPVIAAGLVAPPGLRAPRAGLPGPRAVQLGRALVVVPGLGQILEGAAVHEILRDGVRVVGALVAAAAVRAGQLQPRRAGGPAEARHCPAALLALVGLRLLEELLDGVERAAGTQGVRGGADTEGRQAHVLSLCARDVMRVMHIDRYR